RNEEQIHAVADQHHPENHRIRAGAQQQVHAARDERADRHGHQGFHGVRSFAKAISAASGRAGTPSRDSMSITAPSTVRNTPTSKISAVASSTSPTSGTCTYVNVPDRNGWPNAIAP